MSLIANDGECNALFAITALFLMPEILESPEFLFRHWLEQF
jgi:hypothetical protein